MARVPSRFAPTEIEGELASAIPLSNGHARAAAAAAAVGGILEVEVHQARNIHNICIHEKQDVYAKLYILENGVETTTYCTDVVSKGGKDPVFNHKFETSPVSSDCVLRCEVWMSSKLKGYLEDQQLGTVSVPLWTLVGKKKQFTEYELSTTELFHSPAGSISMTLEFRPEAVSIQGMRLGNIEDACNNREQYSKNEPCDSGSCTSACSDGPTFSVLHSASFTDLEAAREEEELVSDFIRKRGKRQSMASNDGILMGPPYLIGESVEEEGHLGNKNDEEQQQQEEAVSEGDQVVNAAGPNTDLKKKLQVAVSTSSSILESSIATSSVTPSSRAKDEALSLNNNSDGELGKLALPETIPEPRIFQEEIMDMYMKSMQQFSDALAKMQLPIVDDNGTIKPESDPTTATTSAPASASTSDDSADKKSKDGSTKVFYGSRAFF